MTNGFNIPENIRYEMTWEVKEQHVAKGVGLDVEVLSTPHLVYFIEITAHETIKKYIPKTHTTVGVRICIDHLKATPKGDYIKTIATLTSVEGKRLIFKVEAYDSDGLVAKGEHIRYIVNKEKFKNKILKT